MFFSFRKGKKNRATQGRQPFDFSFHRFGLLYQPVLKHKQNYPLSSHYWIGQSLKGSCHGSTLEGRGSLLSTEHFKTQLKFFKWERGMYSCSVTASGLINCSVVYNKVISNRPHTMESIHQPRKSKHQFKTSQ